MVDTTTLNENTRTIDGTEYVRLATTGANWKATLSNIFSAFGGSGSITIGAEPISPSAGDYWIDLSSNAYIRVTVAPELDPARTNADIVLSGGNIIATGGAGLTNYGNSFSLGALDSGKADFQVTVNTDSTPGVEQICVGVGNATASFASGDYPGGDNNSIGWFDDGLIYLGGSSVATVEAYTTGDVLSVAVDYDASLIWFRVNAGDWNNTPTGDPETGTDGIDISAITGALYAVVQLDVTGDQVTIDLAPGLGLTGYTDWPTAYWQFIETFGGGTPGGSSPQIQYNNSGAFGGASQFTIVSGQPNVLAGSSYLHDGAILGYSVNNASGRNFFYGTAGNTTVTGYRNVGIGNTALSAITTGYSNLAVGNRALNSETTGAGNTVIGAEAGLLLNGGNYNIAVGSAAMQLATGGNSNIGIGAGALANVSSGQSNVGLGASALAGNLTGSDNFALGDGSLNNSTTASDNVAIGKGAIASNTTGLQNVGIGRGALSGGSILNGCVGIGYHSLFVATADNNVAIGVGTGSAVSTGDLNTLIGNQSGNILTTGRANTIVGPHPGLAAGMSNTIIFSDGDGVLRLQQDSGGTYTNTGTAFILRTKATLANGAAANLGTLANAPAVGNPTKWAAYDDNGTTRYIPMW